MLLHLFTLNVTHMKTLTINLLLFMLIFSIACSSDSEETAIDCTQSGIKLSLQSSTKADCTSGGSAIVKGTGGTSPYEFKIGNGSFQSSNEFSNLGAGNYTITIKDTNDCTNTLNVTIDEEAGTVAFTTVTTNSDCSTDNGSITVTANGGDGIYTYQLNGGTAQTTSTFNNVGVGSQKVKVTDGSNCSSSLDVVVGSNASLSADIIPIISTNCAISGCHDGKQSPNLTMKSNIIAFSSQIKKETQSRNMPRDGSLSNEEIDLIACWVDGGAEDN